MVEDLFPCTFFIGSVIIFFIFPLAILICIYALIARTLMSHPTNMMNLQNKSITVPSQSVIKYRKQVMVMLGTVVLAFFICLLPFRALTLWIIITPAGSNFNIGLETYYNILYFSRIMFHINSAVNPILYNVMSSKFRGSFLRVCGLRKLKRKLIKTDIIRKSTTSSTTPSTQQTSESGLRNNSCSCSSSSSGSSGKNQSKYSNSLKEVKENPFEEDENSIQKVKNSVIKKSVYIRAPLQIVSGINGQNLSTYGKEIFV